MAPNLPDRYEPQVRLGRDGDVEEWLATDTALDRPVLIRVLSADADSQRQTAFLSLCRGAASVVHNHLAEVYDVGNGGAAPHAVLEWTGGVSIADRLRAGEGIPADEFLANAAGLAEGLAALHAADVIHGEIDPAAIHFSASHPAKLGAFGRPTATDDAPADTAALARTLRAAVTGMPDAAVQPSQIIDGVPAAVDDALEAATEGTIDAAGLAALLHAIPSDRAHSAGRGWTWGWTVPAVILVIAAVLVAVVGLGIESDPDSPFLFPATPSPAQAPPATTGPTTTTTTIPEPASPVPAPSDPVTTLSYTASVFDPPPGDGAEHDAELPNLLDAAPATSWRTERYFSPLRRLKDGVGIAFVLDGDPTELEFTATPGTRYRIRWSAGGAEATTQWDDVASGSVLGAPVVVGLPPRDAGTWLLWLVDLPEQEPDEFFAEIHDVAFRG